MERMHLERTGVLWILLKNCYEQKKISCYKEQLLKQLQDEEFASGYLHEALNDEDSHIFYEH